MNKIVQIQQIFMTNIMLLVTRKDEEQHAWGRFPDFLNTAQLVKRNRGQ